MFTRVRSDDGICVTSSVYREWWRITTTFPRKRNDLPVCRQSLKGVRCGRLLKRMLNGFRSTHSKSGSLFTLSVLWPKGNQRLTSRSSSQRRLFPSSRVTEGSIGSSMMRGRPPYTGNIYARTDVCTPRGAAIYADQSSEHWVGR